MPGSNNTERTIHNRDAVIQQITPPQQPDGSSTVLTTLFQGFEYAVLPDGTNFFDKQWTDRHKSDGGENLIVFSRNTTHTALPPHLRSLADIDQRIRTMQTTQPPQRQPRPLLQQQQQPPPPQHQPQVRHPPALTALRTTTPGWNAPPLPPPPVVVSGGGGGTATHARNDNNDDDDYDALLASIDMSALGGTSHTTANIHPVPPLPQFYSSRSVPPPPSMALPHARAASPPIALYDDDDDDDDHDDYHHRSSITNDSSNTNHSMSNGSDSGAGYPRHANAHHHHQQQHQRSFGSSDGGASRDFPAPPTTTNGHSTTTSHNERAMIPSGYNRDNYNHNHSMDASTRLNRSRFHTRDDPMEENKINNRRNGSYFPSESTTNVYDMDNSSCDSSHANVSNHHSNHHNNYNHSNNNYNVGITSCTATAGISYSNFSNHHNGTGDHGDAPPPCCPGHDLPCLLLTARSEANSGRQFYKCSVASEEENCKFFQWVDGVNGTNWNNNNDGGNGVGSSSNASSSSVSCAPYYNLGGGGENNVKDALTESRRKFGHRSFRPGQQEVIEHAMSGRDVFVLMPTGGGKSLCYQLPAWCCPGLAVVISPLLSLIQDQVQSMTKLGVESVFLASSQDYQSEQMDITRRLNDATAHGGVKLLYITPEKLSNSSSMQSLIRRLHQKNLLSRFVVDEAHSMSDWGHDFRPDYSKLGMLRRDYPGVPLMALTATANEKVVGDAIRALGMRNVFRFTSSFNRPNLRYEVRKKDSKTIDAIAEYISKRPSESGVIYCLSRKDCENLAEKLHKLVRSKPGCRQISVSFYHAELEAHERERRHNQWSNGIISVLCATIAFGMGIDKPDVRYVIHNSMPKSITHYYQESGRAGRDGDKADCILYYNYNDKKILEGMIVKSSNNPTGEATRRKIDQLYSCVKYCEDEFECRRTLQLDFFGERFERSKCNKTCDNCRAALVPERRDLTSVAQTILRLFHAISEQKRGHRFTLVQLMDLFRGSKSKAATKFLDTSRLREYGAGSKYSKPDSDRIAHAMVFERILVETRIENKGGFFSDYIDVSENASLVEKNARQFFVDFPTSNRKAVVELEKKEKTAKKSKVTVSAERESSQNERSASASQQPLALSIDDSSDDGILSKKELTTRPLTAGSKTQSVTILPHEQTRVLISRIKKIATNWAEEERMYGKQVYYWNILSNDAMKSIAAQAPTDIDALKAIGVLGESIINEYGDRIVKIVSSFIEQEGLAEYVEGRPAAKRAKVDVGPSSKGAVEVLEIDDDENDEFGIPGVDFSTMELPQTKTAAKEAVTSSRHFR